MNRNSLSECKIHGEPLNAPSNCNMYLWSCNYYAWGWCFFIILNISAPYCFNQLEKGKVFKISFFRWIFQDDTKPARRIEECDSQERMNTEMFNPCWKEETKVLHLATVSYLVCSRVRRRVLTSIPLSSYLHSFCGWAGRRKLGRWDIFRTWQSCLQISNNPETQEHCMRGMTLQMVKTVYDDTWEFLQRILNNLV